MIPPNTRIGLRGGAAEQAGMQVAVGAVDLDLPPARREPAQHD